MIQQMDSTHELSFDMDVSHHLVLITPSEKSQSQHLMEVSTRLLYEQISDLAKIHVLDAALLYKAFKDVNQITAAACDTLFPLAGNGLSFP